MFLASPSLANKNKLDDLLSRKHDTYNCLCGKLNVPTSKPRTDIVWRWELLIVIAKFRMPI